jgi:tyrosine-protein kinase Etk/Wzc
MLEFFNKKLILLPEKQMKLVSMVRDSEILNENYSFLRRKFEEAKLNVAVKTGDAFLLDSAKKPNKPISQNSQRTILLFVVLGLGLGLVIIFILEILDNTLKTIDEIEKYNLSILGIIPSIGKENSVSQNSVLKRIFKNKKISNANVKRKLMMKEDPKSPISEAYRALRTSMLFSTEKKIKSIVVSSAGPGEGKTTTVANLAITYANLGKKTLLIDTDLRRPVIDKVFDLPREPGVTNFITSQTDDHKMLIKKTEIENLSVITSGVIPPNPSEMLGSKRMADFVRKLEGDFDMILFDSPPLIAVTDANMISREIDQIILVVKVGQTDKKAFHHTVNSLKNINAPLGGIIMNAVTNKTSYGSYYYYYQQYYHYYGNDNT